MEYYNRLSNAYKEGLKQPHKRYLLKIELLSHQERPIGEILKDISVTARGEINVNYNQISRRTCSLTLMNIKGKYAPNQNHAFWINRKFKLWLGLKVENDIYWWAQGVYITKSATGNTNEVKIEAVDKGGLLDGALNVNPFFNNDKTIIKAGSNIANIVEDTLAAAWGSNINIGSQLIRYGGNRIIDPVEPLIDFEFMKATVQKDIEIAADSFMGTLFEELATNYGADAYYNRDGRFVFTKIAEGVRADGYNYMDKMWDFDTSSPLFSNANYEYDFSGVNAVTAYTNSTEENVENQTYTAYNSNPLSPMRVDSVGIRHKSVEINYVDVEPVEMKRRCKDYAKYVLQKESIVGMSLSFNTTIMPHFDVNRPIGITDKYQQINNEIFVVQSITIPLSADVMSVTATNINWLPLGMEMEGK